MIYILKIEREDDLEGEKEERAGYLIKVEQEKEEEKGMSNKEGLPDFKRERIKKIKGIF